MLPTDRLHHSASSVPHDAPLIVTGMQNRMRIVVDADRKARTLGVTPGMKVSHAKALAQGLVCQPCDPMKDEKFLQALVTWALRYAPHTSTIQPDGLWIDSTGSSHLHGGEQAMLDDIITRLGNAGIHAQAAIAETPGAAYAVVRFSGVPASVVADGYVSAALTDLPIEALRLSDDMTEGLKQIGFDRIGQLAAAPRASLVKRFSEDIQLRLDQAFGHVPEPIMPERPPLTISAKLSFPEPITTAESLAAAINKLTEHVCADLGAAGLGARQLGLWLDRVDRTSQVVLVGTAKPSRTIEHLSKLLKEKLERIDPGLGVESMRLIALATESLDYRQAVFRIARRPEAGLPALIDTLTNKLGPGRVYRPMPVESYIPERSVERAMPLARPKFSWPPSLPRPTRLLSPPQSVLAVEAKAGRPPVAFVWRRTLRRVCRSDGPERIGGEWWKPNTELHAKRDYFAVEDADGQRYWLFCQERASTLEPADKAWFLHGLF